MGSGKWEVRGGKVELGGDGEVVYGEGYLFNIHG